MSYGTICGIIANENILLSNSFAKLLSEMEKYVLQYSGSLIKKKPLLMTNTSIRHVPARKNRSAIGCQKKVNA